jgi:mannose-6-phosphate isomerase-like protein (cupin superfamily)
MSGGWFIGNFFPAAVQSTDFEVTVRKYAVGAREPKHFQLTATEVTVVIEGQARMGDQLLNANDIIVLDPRESYDFEALSDVTLVAVKFPSIPKDKVLD